MVTASHQGRNVGQNATSQGRTDPLSRLEKSESNTQVTRNSSCTFSASVCVVSRWVIANPRDSSRDCRSADIAEDATTDRHSARLSRADTGPRHVAAHHIARRIEAPSAVGHPHVSAARHGTDAVERLISGSPRVHWPQIGARSMTRPRSTPSAAARKSGMRTAVGRPSRV
jgi:hypothetical protein